MWGFTVVERKRKIHAEKILRGKGEETPVNIPADCVTVTWTTDGLNCEIKCRQARRDL